MPEGPTSEVHAGAAPTGLEMGGEFYREHVAPTLRDIPHAAALLGEGSEALGLDDQVSTDHDFRTRVQVFADSRALSERVATVTKDVPGEVEAAVVGDFFEARLGFDPAHGVALDDWLTTPTQRFATLTQGAVFHDPAGLLGSRRESIAWYPDDVWRYVLSATWLRISQHEAFLGRAGGRGDELGSALVGARVVRDVVRLGFLIERTWAPYDKWLGTAFRALPLAAQLGPELTAVLDSSTWRERERALGRALSFAAGATNDLALAEPVDPSTRQYYTRDIQVLGGARLTQALVDAISDPQIVALLERLGAVGRSATNGIQGIPGAIDQVTDNVDVLTHVDRCRALARALGLL